MENNDSYLICSVCSMPQHLKCTTISQATFKELTKPSPQVFFTCGGCSSTAQQLLQGIQTQNSELKALAETVRRQQELINGLSGKIDQLLITQPVHSVADRETSNNDAVEQAVTEIRDIERRKTNAVIFNLAEFVTTPANQTKPPEFDTDLAKQLMVAIAADNLEISTVYRLGKGDSGKRPLKIVFTNAESVPILLKKASNLKGVTDARFKQASIRRDLTKMQQQHESKLYQSFKTRKAQGEHIRFIDGRIVPLGSNSQAPQ